jgi:hypothetical protein
VQNVFGAAALLLYLTFAALGLCVAYWVIRLAVHHGMRDALRSRAQVGHDQPDAAPLRTGRP